MKEKEIVKILVPFVPGEWVGDELGNYSYKKDGNLKLISKINDSKSKKSVTINDPDKKPKQKLKKLL